MERSCREPLSDPLDWSADWGDGAFDDLNRTWSERLGQEQAEATRLRDENESLRSKVATLEARLAQRVAGPGLNQGVAETLQKWGLDITIRELTDMAIEDLRERGGPSVRLWAHARSASKWIAPRLGRSTFAEADKKALSVFLRDVEQRGGDTIACHWLLSDIINLLQRYGHVDSPWDHLPKQPERRGWGEGWREHLALIEFALTQESPGTATGVFARRDLSVLGQVQADLGTTLKESLALGPSDVHFTGKTTTVSVTARLDAGPTPTPYPLADRRHREIVVTAPEAVDRVRAIAQAATGRLFPFSVPEVSEVWAEVRQETASKGMNVDAYARMVARAKSTANVESTAA